ncbi:MAG: M23 family metallopeptidase [Terriglobales bacterium]
MSDKDGGDGIYIRVPNNATPAYDIILWHLPPTTDTEHWVIPNGQGVITPVKAGQLIGYTGNSGYPLESTGPHLHLGVIPCDATGAALDFNNGYDGCVDPMPFFNGQYAADINATPITEAVAPVVQAVNDIVQETATSPATPSQKELIIQKVESFLEELKQLL